MLRPRSMDKFIILINRTFVGAKKNLIGNFFL